MNDIDIACPNCSELLVLDPGNESREVACPYCDTLVQMPKLPASSERAVALSAQAELPPNTSAPVAAPRNKAAANPTSGPDSDKAPSPPPGAPDGTSGGNKNNIPAPRGDGEKPRVHAVDTNLALGKALGNAVPETMAVPPHVAIVERTPSHLPEKRGPRETGSREVPPPAASIPAVLDLHKMERGGLHGFACPACGRPLWIKKKDSGGVIICESCSSEIAAPDLQSGAPARVLSQPESQPRPKTVLPEHRHADRPIGERIEAGKDDLAGAAKADLPAPRPPEAVPKLRVPITPAPATSPAEPPTVPAAPAVQVESLLANDNAVPVPANFRLGENRRLRLTPKSEVEGDPEVYQAWGVDLDAAELRRRKNRRIIVASVVLALPLVGVLIWLALTRHFTSAATTDDQNMSDGSQAAEEARRAVAVTKVFLSAPSVEEQAKFVRHPEVTAARMAGWHRTQPFKARTTLSFDPRTEEQTVEDITFLMLFVTLDDHVTKAVALEKSSPEYKVDWESYVAWSEIPWSEFLSREPPEPHDLRVVIQHDTYYNFYYSDQGRYFCYKLVDPANSAHCFAYTGLESEAGQKISQMIRRQRHAGEERVKAILKLHFEPAARGHLQAWIDDVVQDGWVKIHP